MASTESTGSKIARVINLAPLGVKLLVGFLVARISKVPTFLGPLSARRAGLTGSLGGARVSSVRPHAVLALAAALNAVRAGTPVQGNAVPNALVVVKKHEAAAGGGNNDATVFHAGGIDPPPQVIKVV